MIYCIDTSGLMDAWCRFYPPASFPGLWTKLDELIRAERLISCDEVLNELDRKADDLNEWAKSRKDIFLPLSHNVQNATTSILGLFPTMVDARTGKSMADPFVVAVAQVRSATVVTGEKPTGSRDRPKIPDVCAHFGIPCIDMLTLIAREGWKF